MAKRTHIVHWILVLSCLMIPAAARSVAADSLRADGSTQNVTVSCRVLDLSDNSELHERIVTADPVQARACETGAIAFIVPDHEIELVPGADPVPLPQEEVRD